MSLDSDRSALRSLLLSKSVKTGSFTLASGKQSDLYVDCRVTTLDANGALLVGRLLHSLYLSESARLGITPAAVGGLTLGADPLSLSLAMTSAMVNPDAPIQAYTVRKEPKGHGRGRRIEGNFTTDAPVIVVDDVITTGDSTLKAIQAVEEEGGKVAFVLVLVDRQEGGRENIESKGYPVASVFTRQELLGDS
jgi:orotate phosphoribosyltransferase